MNSSDNGNYHTIQQVIKAYLRENYLPKIACFTNNPPNHYDRRFLLENFNYICFCVHNNIEKSRFLLLKYLRGYKKVSFDVVVGTPQVWLQCRQFGYIHLNCEDMIAAYEMIEHIARNKVSINRRYPIIVRLKSKQITEPLANLPHNTKLKEMLSNRDILLRVI